MLVKSPHMLLWTMNWLVDNVKFLNPDQRDGQHVYVTAALLMVIALMIRLMIAPVSAGLQYITFFPAVTLAAMVGGWRAGLFSTAIGIVFATYIFTLPYYSFSMEAINNSLWANIVFLLDGFIVSYSIEYMHRYREKYRRELQEVRYSEGQLSALNNNLNKTISELRTAESQLRIAAATFDSHEAIMITDANANIIRVNRSFEDVTGYSADEVIGKNPRILKSGRQDGNFYIQMWSKLLKTGNWKGEIWDRNKNGSIYPKEMTITAVKNELDETTQYVAIFSDISRRKKAERRIHNLAFYDALTGLPNRRLLLDRLSVATLLDNRTKRVSALIFLDMDNFKLLNDTMGHAAGDLMLIEVAQRLKKCVREIDTVARFGGDEFVLLLENVGANKNKASHYAAQIAEKIRAVLATPYRVGNYVHNSTPSIGVSIFSCKETTADELIRHTDLAMYKAKSEGRNKVMFYDPQMQQSMLVRTALEFELREAISKQQLSLHYQIQVDQDCHPTGAEALIRWNHPQRGLVPPADFIPFAEESTLILNIGDWVLDTACSQLSIWSANPQMSHLSLAVNISVKQFNQPDFVDKLASILRNNCFDHSRLKLELTESIALGDLNFAVERLHELKQLLGITIAMDDFGIGYSSLSYLRQLPFDQIKIDQSFIRNIATNASDAILVKTIIDMAKNLGFEVIAEGVETENQLAFLRENGCLAYQGYLFGKPVSLEKFNEKLLGQPELV